MDQKPLLSKVLKLAIVGDSGVGKSEFISSYNNIVKNFESPSSSINHKPIASKTQSVVKPTIAVDEHAMILPYDDDNDVKVIVYDTSGKTQYKGIYKDYLRYCQGIIIMFDLSSPVTISAVFSWLDFCLTSINNTSSPISVFIVGNKIDKLSSLEIDTESRIDKFMNNLMEYEKQINYKSIVKNYFYQESSAKTYQNVEEIMNYMILRMMEI